MKKLNNVLVKSKKSDEESFIREYNRKRRLLSKHFDKMEQNQYLDMIFGTRKRIYLCLSPGQRVIMFGKEYPQLLRLKRIGSKGDKRFDIDVFSRIKKPVYVYYADFFMHQPEHKKVIKLHAFVVDIDFVLYPDAKRIVKALVENKFPITPNAVINSGKGFHFIFNIPSTRNEHHLYLFDQLNSALENMVIDTLKRIGVKGAIVDKKPISHPYAFPGSFTKLAGERLQAFRTKTPEAYDFEYLIRSLSTYVGGSAAYAILYSCKLPWNVKAKNRKIVKRLGWNPAKAIKHLHIVGWKAIVRFHNAGKVMRLVKDDQLKTELIKRGMHRKSKKNDTTEKEVKIGNRWYTYEEYMISKYPMTFVPMQKKLKVRSYKDFIDYIRKYVNRHKDFEDLLKETKEGRVAYYVRVYNPKAKHRKIYRVQLKVYYRYRENDAMSYLQVRKAVIENIAVVSSSSKSKAPNKTDLQLIKRWIHLLVQDNEYLIYEDPDNLELRDKIFTRGGQIEIPDLGKFPVYDLDATTLDEKIKKKKTKRMEMAKLYMPNAHVNFFDGLYNKLLENPPKEGFRNKTFFILGVAAKKTRKDAKSLFQCAQELYNKMKKRRLTNDFTWHEAWRAVKGGYDEKYMLMRHREMMDYLGWEKQKIKKKVVKNSQRIASLSHELEKYKRMYRVAYLFALGYRRISDVAKKAGLAESTIHNFKKNDLFNWFWALKKKQGASVAFNAVKEQFKLSIQGLIKHIEKEKKNVKTKTETVWMPSRTQKKMAEKTIVKAPKKDKDLYALVKIGNKELKEMRRRRRVLNHLNDEAVSSEELFDLCLQEEFDALLDEILKTVDDVDLPRVILLKWKDKMRQLWEANKEIFLKALYDETFDRDLEDRLTAYNDRLVTILFRIINKVNDPEKRERLIRSVEKKTVRKEKELRRYLLKERLELLIRTKFNDFRLDKLLELYYNKNRNVGKVSSYF